MTQRGFPFVSPTGSLIGLLFILVAMWYAASSQNNAAAYLLMFALTSVFLASIPHTLLNLGGLKATAESVKPGFAGQEVSLPIEITNESRATRHGILLSLADSGSARERIDDIPAGKAVRVMLRFSAPTRGEHEIGKLCLASVYPLGFVQMLKRVAAPQRYIIYPKPAGDPNLPMGRALSAHRRSRPELGEGD